MVVFCSLGSFRFLSGFLWLTFGLLDWLAWGVVSGAENMHCSRMLPVACEGGVRTALPRVARAPAGHPIYTQTWDPDADLQCLLSATGGWGLGWRSVVLVGGLGSGVVYGGWRW